MTFIIAIQLNDSVIVTADNKEIVLKKGEKIPYLENFIYKIHSWDKGMITGTGESNLIKISVALFKEFDGLKVDELPTYLEISKNIREIELGTDYFQVQNTKLICSNYSEYGAQLYKIECFEPSSPYTLTAIEPMNITVWMFNPNINTIYTELQSLYTGLKDASTFLNQVDWINYYINRLAPIYQQQSQVDAFMSQSFDFFFQTKDEYFTGHIPNTQKTTLEFKEISSNIKTI